MEPRVVEAVWRPHPKQLVCYRRDARFEFWACGRKFGKTTTGTYKLLKRMKPKGLYIWGAPTYDLTNLGYAEALKSWPREIVRRTRAGAGAMIGLANGAIVAFKSLDNPDNARGINPDGAFIDEAAYVSAEAWHQVMRPNLMAMGGWMVAASTPAGRNWFHDGWVKGGSGGLTKPDEGYLSHRYSSWDNPLLARSDLEEAKRSMPERWYAQEIMAEFVENAGGVFRNVRRAASLRGDGYMDGEPYIVLAPVPGQMYAAGVDVAKHVDFTSIVIRDGANQVCYIERFNQVDYELQKHRVIEAVRRYNNASVACDQTGVGDPFVEGLYRAGLDVRGFTFTSLMKQQLADSLSILFDKGSVKVPNVPVYVNELVDYEYEITKARNLRMGAPAGKHDDFVVATMLAFAIPVPTGGFAMVGVASDGNRAAAPDGERGDPFGLRGKANDPFR